MQANGHDTRSVVTQLPLLNGWWGGANNIVLQLAQVADDIPAWGTRMRERDSKLREFVRQESFLQSAIWLTTARYASFKFVLEGPERQVNIMHRILHNSEHGRGWQAMMLRALKDRATQDNGYFIETLRVESNNPTSPIVQLNHLDAGRCMRTGNWETPVLYTDLKGGVHELKYYQVIYGSEYESPDERMRGYQECAVSRVLIKAQKARDTDIYLREKIGGRFNRQVHLVTGIAQQRIIDQLAVQENQEENAGLLRYSPGVIIAGLDPSARLGYQRIDLASLPDNWDLDSAMRWYVIEVADAIGVDPQDIAPLPGGNLGSAQQSQVLSRKGRGKGPALFISEFEHIMNFHGIMPNSIAFRYQEQDLEEEEQRMMLDWRTAQIMNLLTKPQAEGAEPVLDVKIARQLLHDRGFLSDKYLEAMGEADVINTVERISDQKAHDPAGTTGTTGWWGKLRRWGR